MMFEFGSNRFALVTIVLLSVLGLRLRRGWVGFTWSVFVVVRTFFSVSKIKRGGNDLKWLENLV